MKKLFFIFAFFLTLNFSIVSAEIIKTASLDPLETTLKKADAETLVIFDVDGVLIADHDQILKPPYKNKFKEFSEKLEKKLGEKKSDEILSITYLEQKNGLIFFKNLRYS